MYQNKIKEIDAKIQTLQAKRFEILREWVDKHHPHSIGDKVIVNGYSYNENQMVITKRWVERSWVNWRWHATGNIIKSNGEQGKQIGEWSEAVSPEKLEIIKEK